MKKLRKTNVHRQDTIEAFACECACGCSCPCPCTGTQTTGPDSIGSYQKSYSSGSSKYANARSKK